MNCSPGDIAYIVSSDFEENVGRPVEVTGLGAEGEGGWWWYVKSASLLAGWTDGNERGFATHMRIFDHDLRPISAPPVRQLRIEDSFNPIAVALGIRRRILTQPEPSKVTR